MFHIKFVYFSFTHHILHLSLSMNGCVSACVYTSNYLILGGFAPLLASLTKPCSACSAQAYGLYKNMSNSTSLAGIFTALAEWGWQQSKQVLNISLYKAASYATTIIMFLVQLTIINIGWDIGWPQIPKVLITSNQWLLLFFFYYIIKLLAGETLFLSFQYIHQGQLYMHLHKNFRFQIAQENLYWGAGVHMKCMYIFHVYVKWQSLKGNCQIWQQSDKLFTRRGEKQKWHQSPSYSGFGNRTAAYQAVLLLTKFDIPSSYHSRIQQQAVLLCRRWIFSL